MIENEILKYFISFAQCVNCFDCGARWETVSLILNRRPSICNYLSACNFHNSSCWNLASVIIVMPVIGTWAWSHNKFWEPTKFAFSVGMDLYKYEVHTKTQKACISMFISWHHSKVCMLELCDIFYDSMYIRNSEWIFPTQYTAWVKIKVPRRKKY